MDKAEKYKDLALQSSSLISGESDLIANLANITALVHSAFNFHWTGFYLVKDDELVLGPFQGPVACTRIKYGKGVCGMAWKTRTSQIVPDVNRFEGHIACSPYSKSEIVIPLFKNDAIWAVFDIDSANYDTFDQEDERGLNAILSQLKID